MGYSLDLFTNPQIDEEFLCPICHDVIQVARVLHPCEHVFCGSCINIWRRDSKICPCDRRNIEHAKEPQRQFLNMLNKLELKCPFNANGCDAILKVGYFQEHDQTCKFNPENQKECDGGCGAVLTQAERKPGAYGHTSSHSCTQYLKDQWQVTKDELQSTKDKLKNSEEKLKQTEEKLDKNRAKFLDDKLKFTEEQFRATQDKLRVVGDELQFTKDLEQQLREANAKMASTDAEHQATKAKLQSSEEQLQKIRENFKTVQGQLSKSLGAGQGVAEGAPAAKIPRLSPEKPDALI